MSVERTILLVDDEPNILRALRRTLRAHVDQIHVAASGPEGLELLKQHKIGVIISDQRMPEMTGSAFLRQAKLACPETVRIMLSGYTDLQSVTDAINEGAIYKFLTKPWDDELLKANIRDAFEYYHLRNENRRLNSELKVANIRLNELNQQLAQRVVETSHQAHLCQRTLSVAQEVLEAMPVAVLGVDDAGIIVSINRVARHLFREQGAVIGQMVDEVLPLASSGDTGLSVVTNGGPLRLRTPVGALSVYGGALEQLGTHLGWILVCVPEAIESHQTAVCALPE